MGLYIDPKDMTKEQWLAKNGTEVNLENLSRKIDSLQRDVNVLINAITELVSMIKEEVKRPPLKRKRLPPPPRPSGRTLGPF